MSKHAIVVVAGAAAVVTVLTSLMRKLKKKKRDKKVYQSEYGYASKVYRGVVYPPFIDWDKTDDLRARIPLRESDIVIATFPKCGTTWMQQIVLTLLAGGRTDVVRDPMKMSPWAERNCSMDSVDAWNAWQPNSKTQVRSPPRRVIKTHAPSQLAPWKNGTTAEGLKGKVIVVMRNPKDTAVSMWHHTRDIPPFEYTGDFNDFVLNLFIAGKVESGCYWDWYSGWYKVAQQFPQKVLLVKFEDLKKDLRAGVEEIARFTALDTDEEVVVGTIKASTFSSMKKVAAEEDAAKLKRGEWVKKNHIREGKKGGWINNFTNEQNSVFDRHHQSKCRRLGLPQKLFQFA